MTPSAGFKIRELQPNDVTLMRAMMTVFGEAFNDSETYTQGCPSTRYLERLLRAPYIIALAAIKDTLVVGGVVAYELMKFEQERSEMYIYDLAVAEAHRRQGIATALVEELKALAEERNACSIFVQADSADAPAIGLYTKLGAPAEVLHFNIGTGSRTSARRRSDDF
jgi:aminoglycoside 3-N-acetyltransferase I